MICKYDDKVTLPATCRHKFFQDKEWQEEWQGKMDDEIMKYLADSSNGAIPADHMGDYMKLDENK